MAREGTEGRRSVTFLWRIENLSQYESKFHWSGSLSPPFTVCTVDEKRLCLKLRPKGITKDDTHLRLSLHQWGVALDFPIDCECSILDSLGSPLVTGTVRSRPIPSILPVCPTQEEVFVTRKSSFLPHDTLTVRCRIWKSSGEFERAEHISARSRIEVRESSFVWPIERFSTLQLGQKVTAPVDLLLFHHYLKLLLVFSLTGASLLDSSVDFAITATLFKNRSLRKPSITFKVSVLDYAQKVVKCVEHKHTFNASDHERTWNVPKFVSRQELLEKESDCLSSGVLTLLCEFTVGYFTGFIERIHYGPSNLNREIVRNASTFSEISCQQRSDSSDILRGNLLYLYQEQTFSDFELRSEDVSFPVHKSVLSARSPVFRAMFSSDMKESDSNFLDVPDLDAHTLNRMLTFLYTGDVEQLQWEGAAKLYYAADKYQVSSLKQMCTSTLRSNMALSNVCDILALADRHQDQELTWFVYDFILNHYFDVSPSEEWGTFRETHADLARTTMRHVQKRKFNT